MNFVHGVKLLPEPNCSVVGEVKWNSDDLTGPLLLEPDPQL